ncbi:hypothetical protein AVEN_29398-1 [Araneus ventricosus]|uniref:Uncharacterized protein n=1 Tax=Araneus ventricosus TaxID=182803 RepID=A0A4Y2TGJ0_ARAVE|nr:hypothetical protein AVEN_29398-1 [Araneus ventricosus]
MCSVFYLVFYLDLGGLEVRSRLLCRRAPGSKPDSTEVPLCIGPVARQIIRRGAKRPPDGEPSDGVPASGVVPQNYDIRPKIVIVFLLYGTLI